MSVRSTTIFTTKTVAQIIVDTEFKLAEINNTEMREVFESELAEMRTKKRKSTKPDFVMFYTVVCDYLDMDDFDFEDDIGGNRNSDDDE